MEWKSRLFNKFPDEAISLEETGYTNASGLDALENFILVQHELHVLDKHTMMLGVSIFDNIHLTEHRDRQVPFGSIRT